MQKKEQVTAAELANGVFRGDYVIDIEDAVGVLSMSNPAKTHHDDLDSIVRRAHETVVTDDPEAQRVEIRGVVPDLIRTAPEVSDEHCRVMVHAPRKCTSSAASSGEYLTVTTEALIDTREWQ